MSCLGKTTGLRSCDSEQGLRLRVTVRRPLAAMHRHRNSLLADQIGQRQVCEKFRGTINTVLCYRLTLRKPFLLRKHRLVNMFVTEEASFVFRSLPIHE